MKQLKVKIFIFVFVVLFLSTYICTSNNLFARDTRDNQEQTADLPSPWERLVNLKFLYLKFTHSKQDTKKYIQAPVLKPVRSKEKVKVFILKMKPVKKALKKAGVNEPVTIELHSQGFSVTKTFLGTFAPLSEKNGKSKAFEFSIPNNLPISFSKKYLNRLVLFRLRLDHPLDEPEICILVFKDASGNIKAELDAWCYFPFGYERSQYHKLDKLIAKEKYEEAETYCAAQKGEIQKACYRILGDAFFEKADYPRAILYHEKSEDKHGFDKIGSLYFEKGDYVEAVKYYERGTHSIPRANAYGALADYYKSEAKPALAKKYFTKAIDEYEYMIRDYHYVWTDRDNNERRRCMQERAKFPKSEEEKVRQAKLARILKKARTYCRRLKEKCFHFFCQEAITEHVNLSKEENQSIPVTRKYIYEYQLINEDNAVKEMRTLLQENSLKKDVKDAQLMTHIRYEKLIFGPTAFLSKHWQDYYDYKILEEVFLNGEKVTVIEAIPRNILKINPLIGKIWVKEEKGGVDILKLEWNPKTIIENFEQLLKFELMHKSKLEITFFVEFNIKRKGFRLPSKYFIEEAFINKNGKKFVRSKTNVLFKKHKYFSVGTEVLEAAAEGD